MLPLLTHLSYIAATIRVARTHTCAHEQTRSCAQIYTAGGGDRGGDEGERETKTMGGEKARNPSEDPRARGRVVLQRAAPGRPQRPPGLKHR